MPIFPVVDSLIHLRRFLNAERPMIAKLIADGKLAADAVRVVAADVSALLAAGSGLFGVTASDPDAKLPKLSEMRGTWGGEPGDVTVSERTTWRQQHLVRRVKRSTEREYREHGLTNVAGCPAGVSLAAVPGWEIASVWPEAEDAGAVPLILAELGKVDGFAALIAEPPAVGGVVADWLRQAWAWVLAHQDEILAIAKVLLQFLAMLLLI